MEWLIEYPYILLIAVCAVAFLESFALLGILVPGVVLLFSLAALANAALIPPLTLLAFGAIGAFMGDVCSFLIGRTFRDKIEHWRWFRTHQNWLDQGTWFIQKWGWLSVIIGRFLGPLRPVIPLVAGTLGMPPKLFIPLSSITVLVWAPAYLLPGYFTGELAELWTLQPLSTRSIIVYALTALAISGSAIAIYHHAHPERWHLRGWITKRQAERWPVLSSALTVCSVFLVAVLWVFPRRDLDERFQALSESFSNAVVDTLLKAVEHSATAFTASVIVILLALWLTCRARTTLAALSMIIFSALVIVMMILGTQFHGNVDSALNLASAVFAAGLVTSLVTSDIHGLKRWPSYLICSQVMAAFAFSYVWSGSLTLHEAMSAVLIGIAHNGLFRGLWQGLHLPLRIELSGALISLLMLVASSIAWLSLMSLDFV